MGHINSALASINPLGKAKERYLELFKCNPSSPGGIQKYRDRERTQNVSLHYGAAERGEDLHIRSPGVGGGGGR
jgi:hypothetical protein